MNRNIEKIILHLEDEQRDDLLCKVGQARLRWWKRHGKKFRTLKAALSTWTVSEINAWFEYANINHDRAGRAEKTRSTYWAVDDLADALVVKLSRPLKAPARRLLKQVSKWLEVEGKKNLLNRPERQLLGDASQAHSRTRK